MQSEEQRKFILTPIVEILQEAVNACKGIGQGIETQSLSEYVLQTTFLKMTGAQEQKLKCICWEMATNDYGYRYQYLKKNYGECSSYSDKSSIYKDLTEAVNKMDKRFSVDELFENVDIYPRKAELIAQKIKEAQKNQEKKKRRKLSDEEAKKVAIGMTSYYERNGFCEKEKLVLQKRLLFAEMQEEIARIIGKTLLARWEEHNYLNFMEMWKDFSKWNYAVGDMLLSKELQDLYTGVVYEHRNRCAHNLVSIQKNLPTLRTLEEPEFVYDNYYFRFGMLVLIDEVFVRLFRRFLGAMEKQVEVH